MTNNTNLSQNSIGTELNFNGIAALYRIARVLSAGGSLSSIISEILYILETQAGMRQGMISILNSDARNPAIDVTRGIDDLTRKDRYKIDEQVISQVARTGEAVIITKNGATGAVDKAYACNNLKRTDIAFLCVPIKISDTVIGVLSVDDIAVEQDATLEGELRFLEAVSDLTAQVVFRRRAEAEKIFALEKENRELKQILENRGRPDEMIGNSGSMREVYRYIAQVAPSMATVLIRGETGTGKELVARAIHQKSPFFEGPFIAVNCAAIPEGLMESELFGHEKGSFTGAFASRIGKFEAADNGTLFLDEIGEMSPSAQSRLLRAIQEREFQRIGGSYSIKVKVRIITATNRNLEEDVKDGRFREDLYYRLNVFTIALPPLRERGADILLLADHFVKKYSRLHHKEIERISTPAIEILSSHNWPGNVRELENVIERAVLVSEGKAIEGHDLPPVMQRKNVESGLSRIGTLEYLVSSYEKELIIDALKDSNGSQTEAAGILNTTKRIIQYKIEKYNIDYRKYRGNVPYSSES
jgi:Nif-specific regulatory protein